MREIQKVLLVDDDEDIRVIGEMALSAVGGWTTVLARGGQEAIEVAATEQPDVILLDVMMPGMDGPTTLRGLRERPATATIPVVFVTAKIQRHELQRYRDLGALGVIGKPFDPMGLPKTLRELVQRSWAAETRGS